MFVRSLIALRLTRGGAAARCAEGDRREPFAQRFGALRRWGNRSTNVQFSTNVD
jgi:hypothetical protein